MCGTITDARAVLQRWGSWWRVQESRELQEKPISNGHLLIEIARLGIVSERRKGGNSPADDIIVPEHIEEVDRIVKALPRENRAMINFWYIRAPKLKRGAARRDYPGEYRTLLEAEIMVMRALDR